MAVILEKQTDTSERLLAASVSPLAIVLGKALAGLFFGLTLTIIAMIPLSIISGQLSRTPS